MSETDTEVVAHMLDYYYNGNPLDTIVKIMHRVEGSYALGILSAIIRERSMLCARTVR